MAKRLLSEEFARMQRLAGILSESEYKESLSEEETDATTEKDAEAGLKNALNVLKTGASSIKQSPQDKEVKESATALTLGLVAGAPGLISLLGKGVNAVSSIFQKDGKKGTVVGNALKKYGHELEEAYIGVIGSLLTKAFPQAYEGQNVHDKTTTLYDHAHSIYLAMLSAAAISSALGAKEAVSIIAKGLEGGLSAIKTSEIFPLIQKIAANKPQ